MTEEAARIFERLGAASSTRSRITGIPAAVGFSNRAGSRVRLRAFIYVARGCTIPEKSVRKESPSIYAARLVPVLRKGSSAPHRMQYKTESLVSQVRPHDSWVRLMERPHHCIYMVAWPPGEPIWHGWEQENQPLFRTSRDPAILVLFLFGSS